MAHDSDQIGLRERGRQQEAIERINTLTAKPIVLLQLFECIENPDSTAFDLADIILQDPVIVANILNLANSPVYGRKKKVMDIITAIVVVGFHEVCRIAAASSLIHSFELKLSGGELNIHEFWKYSVACSTVAGQVAELSQYGFRNQAYLFGLLHDIGKLAMLHLFKSEYEEVLCETQAESGALHEKEIAAFEFSHCDAGRWLAEKWNFPNRVIRVIGYHHSLDDLTTGEVRGIFLCHVAEYITRTIGFGANGDAAIPRLHEEAIPALGIQKRAIRHLIQSASLWTAQVKAGVNAISN